MVHVRPYLQKMMAAVEADDYAGYDPYDGLNSPLLQHVGSASKWLRIGFTQTLKRCPINLRPLLGIRKGHNPKGIGLFLWGYSKLYGVDQDSHSADKIGRLLSLLDRLKCKGYSGSCWGYNFDWQSRTNWRPRGTPTGVNSAFIGHALLDCYELTGKRAALNMAVSIKDFILNDLHRTVDGDCFCFSYTPIDRAVVHNANMLSASLLIRLKRYSADSLLEEAALRSLAYSMRYQHEDGSWCYANTPVQRWIDSFHTGFNLQALRYFLDEGYADEYSDSFRKGVIYYANRFFLDDGTPRYYPDRTYPVDIHSAAQAIVFFSGLGPEYRALTDKVLGWMLANLWSDRAHFYFQKHRYYTNRIPYMRWSQAWAFHALTEYLLGCRAELQCRGSQIQYKPRPRARRATAPNSAASAVVSSHGDSVLRAIT